MIVTYITINLNQSWQVAYWIMGGLVIGLGVLVLLSLPQWRLNVPQNDESGHDDHGATLGETVRQPIVILSVLFFFVYGGLEIGTGQLANTLFIESREIPLAIASNWVSAYWGSFTIGRMLMGLLALRIGDKPLLYASLSMGVVGSFLLFLNLSDALSLTGLLLLGFGQAAIFPILISQTPHRVGIRHAANTIGFQVGFAGMGGATLAGIAGVVAENFGIETISAFLFITAIVLFSLYQLIIWWENQPPVMTNINRG
jgi:fucose permease